MAEAEAAKRLISDIGKQLAAQKTCPRKDFLVKLLKQAASAFPALDQLASLESTIKPLSDSLVKHRLLQHKDKDIRLLVAMCYCEIIRILAPNPDFSDAVFRDIFKLFLSMFAELSDTTSPYFSRRVKVLEIVAKLKFCVLMLDTGCENLVLEMFKTFFTVVREHHPQSLISAMVSIMALILREKASQPLLNVILQNLLKAGKGESTASSRLAVSVIQNCADELEPFVCGFLVSCISDRDAVGSEIKECYHEIIFEIFQCAPRMLLAVIPNLSQELLTDQVDVRIKAVNLFARLLALPGLHIAQQYRHLFVEFLKRFSDKSPEVRQSAISCAKAFYMTNPSKTESDEILNALQDRLLDFDDKVRLEAVTIVCDLAIFNLKLFPLERLPRITDRLRDKKVSVRKKALQKLLEVYRDYCTKCSGGIMTISDRLEQIPCGILMLCYDKDCKEFRPQNMELLLAEDLFPASLSIEERTWHWISLFTLFNELHTKALNTILSQKQRLQTEMQIYLALRRKSEEDDSEEVQKRIKTSFVKMSASFADPAKAEECFHKLNLIKDNNIFTALLQLLDEVNIKNGQATRDDFLRKIGDKHPHFGFLRSLSMKCLFNIFSSEHVRCILDHLSSDRFGNKELEASSMKLLLAIISTFPSLLRGSEKQLQLLLLDEDDSYNDELIQILAKAGPHISIKVSDIYPFLERICLEGTRTQSKLAVSAIAALVGTSEQFISVLHKTLVDYLHSGQNIPTVLQSLGCMAQHFVSTFEFQDGEITQYIVDKIIRVDMPDNLGSGDDTSGCSSSCKLKIFGLKALVRSFLPHRGTLVGHNINKLLDVLLQMLQKGDISDCTILCKTDKAHIRLAAAKSVLRLSRRWDLHISPQIFHLTISVAKDSSSFVRRLFVSKTHKLLKKHALPSKYACAFALAASDSLKDLQDDSLKYMEEFIREYSRGARVHQTSTMQGGLIDHPAYLVVFLIHVLAHDTGFPPENCQDEGIYACFCSPLVFTLQALVNATFLDGDLDLVNDAISYLCGIFNAIKRAEDAVDYQRTTKLQILASFGISILNVFCHGGILVSHTPGVILLPSSFYRISLGEKRERGFDENIVERMVHSFKSHISQHASTQSKCGQKSQDDCSQPDVIKCDSLNLALCSDSDVLKSRISEQSESPNAHGRETHETLKQEINPRGRKKRALFPCPPRSVGLHNDFSIDDEDEMGVFGNSEPIVGKELPSSCDSVTTDPSLTLKEDLINSASLKENDRLTKRNNTAEPSKGIGNRYSDPCGSKEIGNKNKVLIRQQIQLWSPIDKCYNSGTVDQFDSQNNTYKDSNAICSLYCNSGEHSSHSGQREMVDEFICDVPQKENFPKKGRANFLNRRIPVPGKEKKRLTISADTSTSEVIDANKDTIARRTRSRKV
ncbi:sister chromatid cohesion protein PDS5 homolog B isoform X2 [Cornus florida]|uniref:sister chromatid cohesion protein PDS5 homolog B isoform X2 n=1 Tax=Cornus florida TaxID=4283 RepID=UPI0028975DF1|nr:sister chromatid cohesion protein PDS5 homolog B isoform X2 [Cornus florida]